MEYNLLNNLNNINNSIISTGGSVVYLKNGMQKLKEIGFIVYLQNTFPIIEKRLTLSKNRGIIIKENQTLLDLYNERICLYEQYAEISKLQAVFQPFKPFSFTLENYTLPNGGTWLVPT